MGKPRKMTGFLAALTPEQRAYALTYDGDDTLGDAAYYRSIAEGEWHTIRIQEREDGGLRVCSPDFPGLVLSGANAAQVAADILPAIKALKGGC